MAKEEITSWQQFEAEAKEKIRLKKARKFKFVPGSTYDRWLRDSHKHKWCMKCHQSKPFAEFDQEHLDNYDSVLGWCKACQSKRLLSKRKTAEFHREYRAMRTRRIKEHLQEHPEDKARYMTPRDHRRAYQDALRMQGLKHCSHCNQVKLFTDFYRDKSRRDGRSTWCGACVKTNTRKYYQRIQTQ